MEIILLENIENLGAWGDTVTVKSGFARNYLIPRNKAQMATVANLAAFEAQRGKIEKSIAETKAQGIKKQQALEDLGVINIVAKVGSEGKLFGSVGASDIADAITTAGQVVDKRKIRLPEGAIRNMGEYTIEIQVHADIVAKVAIAVVDEET